MYVYPCTVDFMRNSLDILRIAPSVCPVVLVYTIYIICMYVHIYCFQGNYLILHYCKQRKSIPQHRQIIVVPKPRWWVATNPSSEGSDIVSEI